MKLDGWELQPIDRRNPTAVEERQRIRGGGLPLLSVKPEGERAH